MIGNLTRPWMLGDHAMRRDLRLLSWMLRLEFKREGQADLWREVVRMRGIALRHEAGDPAAADELAGLFRNEPADKLEGIVRIVGLFFDLCNVTEDLQRKRVLAERRRQGTLSDGLEACLGRMKGREGAAELLDGLEADFVFTAHPTEAKRQTVRRVLDRMRRKLQRLADAGKDRPRRRPILRALGEDIRALVRVDPLHPHRPEVLEELDRALYAGDALWKAIPPLLAPIDRARGGECRPLCFGSWIGGDRDGHPHVTVGVTHEALRRLRRHALRLHLRECQALSESFPMVVRDPRARALLAALLARAQGPRLDQALARLHPDEGYRHAIACIRLRLESSDPASRFSAEGYASGADLERDLRELAEALRLDGLEGRARHRVRRWQRRARVFGLHLMRLDLRENSKGYRTLVGELLSLLDEDPARVERDDFHGLWDKAVALPHDDVLRAHLSERSYDLLAVTRLMGEWAARFSGEGLGANVISMTHCPGDVFWVLWLHRLFAARDPAYTMPISPLFETIDDLRRSADMLRQLFRHPEYREWLRRSGGRQVVMVGYSDSAKDGGYLAACWALYHGQEEMRRVAAEEGVALTCFHGRGGALGRGGGPAARAIMALPPSPGDAHIRMTEQGEVIAERFADPALARRHMEQILGGLLEHAGSVETPPAAWRAWMETFAELGRETYLELFQRPGFPTYFREATPIECIETLPIGSRPSRRHGAASLEDLRAIPYTFSWTQSRQLINAFLGLGSAWERLGEAERELAARMYKEWPFFRSMIDNAELALTKCDPAIARGYAGLVRDEKIGRQIGGTIVDEMNRSRAAILAMTGRPALMADVGWLRRSVEIRKTFIDVLNYVQIELLRRQRALPEPSEQLVRGLRLSVQAIAAGLRTTG